MSAAVTASPGFKLRATIEEATSNPTIENPSESQKPVTLYQAHVLPARGTGSRSRLEKPLSGTNEMDQSAARAAA